MPGRSAPGSLHDALVKVARELAPDTQGEPAVLSERPDGTVVRFGDVVIKAHAPGADAAALRERVRLAATPAVRGVLLQPALPEPRVVCGRLVTVWPAGTPLDPTAPDRAPWQHIGGLLSRLHAIDAACRVATGAPERVLRALRMLDDVAPSVSRTAVCDAFATLPPGLLRGESDLPPALIHGDFHLGQIVHGEPDGTLRLIDVDELGRGDPRWDLARPGAWFAMGLVPEDAWAAFLRGYLADGRAPWFGTWETLDPFARAMVVQGAARALTSAERAGRALEEVEQIHVDACARMVSLPLRASR